MTSPPATETNDKPSHSRTLAPSRELLAALAVMFVVALVYGVSNPRPNAHFDYQFRIARALLSGQLGLDQPISWLNELVPAGGKWYSVFPLGSVLCMLPVALLQNLRGMEEFPARETCAWVAGITAFFLFMLTSRYGDRWQRRALLLSLIFFGSWYWCNVVWAGAWHLALALAFMGQCGALAFTLVNRQPVFAGLCFAIGFGNRTEILLTAPLYFYLLARHDPYRDGEPEGDTRILHRLKTEWKAIAGFCVFPFLLGVATLWYNYARFGALTDFGYERIPNLLHTSPWLGYGLFTWRAIPFNIQAMLLSSSWRVSLDYPFFAPETFGGGIFSSCPYLVFLFRDGGRDRGLRLCAWLGIALTTLVLWLHADAGGWQFSYRYALVPLAWVFVLLLDQARERISFLEGLLFSVSFLANAWAIYQFYWTEGYRF